jgi:uncharacterized membrane protein YagU involved in acid resistance
MDNMKNLGSKILVFISLIIIWCSATISQRFLHELSIEEWIKHILFGIIFAVAFTLIVEKNKVRKLKSQGIWIKIGGFIELIVIWCCVTISGQFLHKLSTSDKITNILFGIIFATTFIFIVKKITRKKQEPKEKID